MRLRTLKDYVDGRLRRSLIVLWSAVGVILLIACVNLSNLLLARAAARGKEFAVRSALGASRGRIARQLLTESLVLSSTGALFGLGLAFLLLEWLAHQGSLALPLLSRLRIDGAALEWTALPLRSRQCFAAWCRLCAWPAASSRGSEGHRRRVWPGPHAPAYPLRTRRLRGRTRLHAPGRRRLAAAQLS